MKRFNYKVSVDSGLITLGGSSLVFADRGIRLEMLELKLGRISCIRHEKSRISINIQQGMPENPAGYPASGKEIKSGPTLVGI